MSSDVVEMSLSDFINEQPRNPYCRRVICEYTSDGKFIKAYNGLVEASKAHPISETTIGSCCNGRILICNKVNRIFLYGDASIEQRLQKIQLMNKPSDKKHLIQIREYMTDGKYVKTWQGYNSVVKAFSISLHRLKMHLKGSIEPIKGRFFLTGEESIEGRVTALLKERQKEIEKNSLVQCANEAIQIDVYTSGGDFLRTCKDPKEVVKIYAVSLGDIYNHMVERALVTRGLMFLPHGADIHEKLEKVKNRKTWKNNL